MKLKSFTDVNPVSPHTEACIFASERGQYSADTTAIMLEALNACRKYRRKRVLHLAFTPQGYLSIVMMEKGERCNVPTLDTLSMTLYTEADIRAAFEWLHRKSGISYVEGGPDSNCPF